jgi:predicted O-methyltransferase YrrM
MMRRESYLSYEDWLRLVVHTDDDGSKTPKKYQCSVGKMNIMCRFDPSKIGEIGVRLGYSAHAFLWAAREGCEYVGYDDLSGRHGGTKIAGFGHVQMILRKDFPKSPVTLVRLDTQKVRLLPDSGFDFFHVDGDHSTEGCTRDILKACFAVKPGGVILIDDYDYIPDVTVAVDEFRREHDSLIESSEYIQTVRGDVVMIRSKVSMNEVMIDEM